MTDSLTTKLDLAGYQALSEGAGLVDFSDRSLVELRGDDRATFLHNFCTADIRKLAPGAGCEAFVLNAQGKILGHVLVFSEPDALVLETVPAEAAKLMAHLDRYLIRERVTIGDRGQERAEWLLAGPKASEVLARALPVQPAANHLASVSATIGGRDVWIRRTELAGPDSLLIEAARATFADIGAALEEAGAVVATREDWNVRRIEVGWPSYGLDISDKNLPQELDRDQYAISFIKGCYLGQETVARIDALGHVNQTLVGVRFAGTEVPAAGSEITSGDRVVGHVTSACFSPRLAAPLALSIRCAEATMRWEQNSRPAKAVAR